MNHHLFFVRPCSLGAHEGNHEHERTVRATIMIVVPFSASLCSSGHTAPWSTVRPTQEQYHVTCGKLTPFQPSHFHPAPPSTHQGGTWPFVRFSFTNQADRPTVSAC